MDFDIVGELADQGLETFSGDSPGGGEDANALVLALAGGGLHRWNQADHWNWQTGT